MLDVTYKEPNSVAYTSEPIYCDATGEQLKQGYELKYISGERIGLFGPDQFMKAMEKAWSDSEDDYIYMRMIVFENNTKKK